MQAKNYLIQLGISIYRKSRLPVVYILFILVLFGPVLEKLSGVANLRLHLLSLCPLLLLFILNDAWVGIAERLKNVERGLHNPDPPTYAHFAGIQDDLEKILDQLVIKGTPITVEIIAVSSMYSWPFFSRVLNKYLASQPNDIKLSVDIAVCDIGTLERWKLPAWAIELNHALNTFELFENRYRAKINNSGITVCFHSYDNLPHWHGVLVNRDILFMGRTEWVKVGDSSDWELRVGQVEYRRFEMKDSYGGASRIVRYIAWFDRYKSRAEQLKSLQNPENADHDPNESL